MASETVHRVSFHVPLGDEMVHMKWKATQRSDGTVVWTAQPIFVAVMQRFYKKASFDFTSWLARYAPPLRPSPFGLVSSARRRSARTHLRQPPRPSAKRGSEQR